jgi:hypothetical protein
MFLATAAAYPGARSLNTELMYMLMIGDADSIGWNFDRVAE